MTLIDRLTAAIDAKADKARAETHHEDSSEAYSCPATRTEPLGSLPFGEDNCRCGLAERRHDVLRMCEAHRELVELHAGPHECREVHTGTYSADWPQGASYGAPGEMWRHVCTEYFETEECPTLRKVAACYDLTEEDTRA